MINENIASAFGMPEITVITDYSITDELAQQCHNMGGVTFYADIVVDPEVYKNKFYAIPDFCFVFMHKATKQPIGYFIILPLTESAILRYMDNKLLYDTIKPNDLQEIQDEQLYNLFFDSMVLTKQYQTSNMARLLFTLLANVIIERARRFSFCNYVLIDQYKDFEKAICDRLNAKFLRTITYTNGRQGRLYGTKFDYTIFQKLPNYPAMQFAYNNKTADEVLLKTKDLWGTHCRK